MTEDKWVKILEKEEEHQIEFARHKEKLEESWKKNSLKNLPIFQSNIERLNKFLTNYNCQFDIPKETSYSYEYTSSKLDTTFHRAYKDDDQVMISAILDKETILYCCHGYNMPTTGKLITHTIYYKDFDKLIDAFIESYKRELIKLKV